MAVELIVEDGTGVSNANSYVSVEEVKAFAENRSLVLTGTEDQVSTMLIRATDYIDSQPKFQGRRTYATQSLSWPRTGVEVDCEKLPGNLVPKAIKAAACRLVMAIADGFDLQPNISPMDYVTQETVGPITTKYESGATNMLPTFTAVDQLLSPLFGNCAFGFGLRTIRV